jgi:hypothetical protein
MSRGGRIALTLAALVAFAASFGLGRRYPVSSANAGNGRRIRFYVDPMHAA